MKRTAYCKINLTLEILGTKRNDGFHDLKSVMHKIPLGDIVELEAGAGSGKIDFFCDSDICPPTDNLAYKAAEMYLEKYRSVTHSDADISIKLSKVTPAGAGLGGGSADAAAVLDMLYSILGGVDRDEIPEMAQKLGSDVPFCLERHLCAYCTGRGEICRSINVLPQGTCLVVAKPVQSINTKGIYGEYDRHFGDDYSKSCSDAMEKALANKNLSDIAECMVNDFEHVCIPRLPEIEDIKRKMVLAGAVGSMMSGSGSAVYGLFDSQEKSRACHEALRRDGLVEVYVFDDPDFQKMYKGE